VSWNNSVYLVDTNTLTQLTRRQRSTDLFRSSVRIPRAVLAEARGLPDISELKALEYPTTASVLRCLVAVLQTVPVDDTRLLDLYRNRGNADPFLVACAVDARNQEPATLFPDTWIVVSGDTAVRDKAAQFQLTTLTNLEFAERLNAATGTPASGRPSTAADAAQT
jgi:hypothetical protein